MAGVFVMACIRAIFHFLWDLVMPQKNRSFWDLIRSALHGLLLSCIVIVLSQQLFSLSEIYAQKQEEHRRALELYAEDCPYKGSSQVRHDECSRNNIIIQSWPLIRAATTLVRSWNSCIYMPCNDLARSVMEHFQYKLVLILVSLGMASYLFNLFSCTKKKSKDYVDKYRLKQTQKAQLKNMMQQLGELDSSVAVNMSSTK